MDKKLSAFALCALIMTAPVTHAQYDAGATHMLGQGMGFSALSSSTYRNSIEATKGSNGKRDANTRQTNKRQDAQRNGKAKASEPILRTQADVDRYMKERMAHHVRALTPEYKRRAARDGQPAADKWIRAKGEELGKMEGERARKLVRRD